MWSVRWLLVVMFSIAELGCVPIFSGPTPTSPGSTPRDLRATFWQDGTYIGENDVPPIQFIRVAVDVAGGRIVAVRLLQHPSWQAPRQQEEILRLVEVSQSTTGHVPRGTGSESDRLLQAIDDALARAQPAPPAQP